MSLLHAVGLTLLPNIGGLAGLVITKKHLKDGWYDVSWFESHSFSFFSSFVYNLYLETRFTKM